MNVKLTDQAVINCIRQDNPTMLRWTYKKHRRSIHRYVLLHKGTLQDAQDLYQDVMLAFYLNVVLGRLTQLTGKLSTYLHKLAQNLWHSRLRRHEPLVGASNLTDYPVEHSPDIAQQDACLQQLMGLLDHRCRLILYLFYFDGLPMRTIAGRVGLTSAESARRHKWICLQKLRDVARRHRITDDEDEQHHSAQ